MPMVFGVGFRDQIEESDLEFALHDKYHFCYGTVFAEDELALTAVAGLQGPHGLDHEIHELLILPREAGEPVATVYRRFVYLEVSIKLFEKIHQQVVPNQPHPGLWWQLNKKWLVFFALDQHQLVVVPVLLEVLLDCEDQVLVQRAVPIKMLEHPKKLGQLIVWVVVREGVLQGFEGGHEFTDEHGPDKEDA